MSREGQSASQQGWVDRVDSKHLGQRHLKERLFRLFGGAAIAFALASLVLLLGSIAWQGLSVFTQYQVSIPIAIDPAEIDPDGTRDPKVMGSANFSALVKASLRREFPEVSGRKNKRRLYRLVSTGASYAIREAVLADPGLLGTTQVFQVPVSAEADLYLKGRISASIPEADRKLKDSQIGWLDTLRERGDIERVFNWGFFTRGDSREPELAGVGGAVIGSILTLLVTLLACFPVGVAAAIHLEEFAPKNRLTDLIEVNINNLAAVPSIVFGLLGLALFLGPLGMPRSAPLVGGLVLALRTLPVIIIVSRSALAAVPPSIREAALGLGASRIQLITHHLLPLAFPGILTGTIIGMAQALGETAPLLMIGMVAFVADIPEGFLSPSTVLPVQIFLWSDAPERGFEALTAGAIIVLMGFLLILNAVAVFLRHRYETRF